MSRHTCILCPLYCVMEAERTVQGGEIAVSGNACKRGEVYVRMEIIRPQRVLTTLFPVRGGGAVPCKTDSPIDKKMLADAVKLVKGMRASRPVKAGDILIKNLFDTGADIIATADFPRAK